MTTQQQSLALTEQQQALALIQQFTNEDVDAYTPRPGRYKLISTSQAFQDVQTDNMVKVIKGVIAVARKQRTLWKEGENTHPVCSSRDGRTGNVDPTDVDTFIDMASGINAEDMVAPFQPMNCLTCPFNQRGTDPKGGVGSYCKEGRRLLILEDGMALPSALTLAPTSIANWDNYASGLAKHKKHFATVHTTIGAEKAVNPKGDVYSVVVFKAGDDLPLSVMQEVAAIRTTFQPAMEAVEED